MTIFVHQPEFEGKEQAVISAIHRYAQPDSIELESDLALIAVVGRGMKSTRGTAGRIFSALAHANINVKMKSHYLQMQITLFCQIQSRSSSYLYQCLQKRNLFYLRYR